MLVIGMNGSGIVRDQIRAQSCRK